MPAGPAGGGDPEVGGKGLPILLLLCMRMTALAPAPVPPPCGHNVVDEGSNPDHPHGGDTVGLQLGGLLEA